MPRASWTSRRSAAFRAGSSGPSIPPWRGARAEPSRHRLARGHGSWCRALAAAPRVLKPVEAFTSFSGATATIQSGRHRQAVLPAMSTPEPTGPRRCHGTTVNDTTMDTSDKGEEPLEWHDPSGLPAPMTPVTPAPLTPAAPAPSSPIAPQQQPGHLGLRRTVLTASLAALLVMGGAVAAVSAASPAPAASSAPTTTDPSNPATPPAGRPNHGAAGSHVNCPNMGGSGSSGNSG